MAPWKIAENILNLFKFNITHPENVPKNKDTITFLVINANTIETSGGNIVIAPRLKEFVSASPLDAKTTVEQNIENINIDKIKEIRKYIKANTSKMSSFRGDILYMLSILISKQ